jgi:hypothetical protein
MRARLKPPCAVLDSETGEVYMLRSISCPNPEMKRRGWKGLVCHVQNRNGTALVEYRRLRRYPERI